MHQPNLDNSEIRSPDLEVKVKRDLTTLLYQQGTVGCIIIIATVTAAASVTSRFEFVLHIHTWWAVLVGFACFRIWDIRRWLKHTAHTEFDCDFYLKRYFVHSIITGALFGFFPYISYSFSDSLDRSIVIFIIAGLAGGASTVLSAYKELAISYVSLLLLPTSFLMIFNPAYNLEVLGVLGIFYWGALALSIRSNSKFIYDAAEFHHHNEALVDAITAEKKLVEESNNKLQQAYADLNSANEELEQKVVERTEELSVLATTDELTSLKNRHTFVTTLNNRIAQAKKNNDKFSLLFVDLDGFKEINDIRGHLIGDKVLKTIAQRLQNSVKNRDFLCRWGGDEFVLIIEEHEPLLLDTVSTRICQTIQQPINIDYETLKITASIGIATFPTHGETTTDLVNASDIAMYELKKGGKNGTMLFETAFMEKIRFEQDVLEKLSTAIEKQQFELFFQPMLPTNKQNNIHFEALIRWKPEEAYIPPVVFIPIAETCDAIYEIGNWIIETVCKNINEGVLGDESCVAMNISIKQLLSRGFINTVKHNIEKYKINSERLQIELTESVFAENLDEALEIINQLRDMGITIALDDFGCGFSSLSYLQKLPIDTIKIDQSFVKQLEKGGEKIIEATVSIADAFSCQVVAEGIESEQQQQQLTQLGVDYLQGFHIAVPCLPQDLQPIWIKDNH